MRYSWSKQSQRSKRALKDYRVVCVLLQEGYMLVWINKEEDREIEYELMLPREE